MYAWKGRLYGFTNWAAKAEETAPWIQIDFLSLVVMKAILTQGSAYRGFSQWVTALQIQTGFSTESLTYIRKNGMQTVGVDNVTKNGIVVLFVCLFVFLSTLVIAAVSL